MSDRLGSISAMATDPVHAAIKKLEAAAATAGLRSPADTHHHVNEIYLIPNRGRPGGHFVGDLDGPASDILDKAVGTLAKPGETTVANLSTLQMLALFEALVQAGVRIRTGTEGDLEQVGGPVNLSAGPDSSTANPTRRSDQTRGILRAVEG